MVARVLYALVFVAIVPIGLAVWAAAMDRVVGLPTIRSVFAGVALLASGLGVMAWAMIDLWRRGGGLPMNAFPPQRLVEWGAYRWLGNPIYVGFVLACFGAAIAAGSPAGFWLAAPLATAGVAALVLGYEADATLKRFGPRAARPLISLPQTKDVQPSAWDLLSVYVLVFLPWLVLYEAVGHLPVPGAIDARVGFERQWPVLVWAEPVYASTYLLAGLAPVVARSRRSLRWFSEVGLVGTGLGILCYLVLPFIAPPRAFEGGGSLGDMLRLERADGLDGRAALPSFHVFWAIVGARVWAERWPRWAAAWWAWCVLTIFACAATGMHAVADLAAGAALAAAAWHWRVWVRCMRHAAEVVANSWREWRIGPVRIISHGVVAGLAAGTGMVIAGALGSPGTAGWLALVGACGLIGAGVWGQMWVGAPTSLRPFGYYGCLIGAGVGLAIAATAGGLGWREAAALCVAAPWIQAIGRVRCLVQGCCHGRPTTAWWGIVYLHPRSRVCRAAGLCGVRVHPTPLYSMWGNVVIGALLARLWSVGAGASEIMGAYLVLSGLARFVEEHYRGEPGTPIVGGLRLYQWFAAASVVIGLVVCSLQPGRQSLAAAVRPSAGGLGVLGWALVVGTMFMVAMGVDVPGSTRRLARLTS